MKTWLQWPAAVLLLNLACWHVAVAGGSISAVKKVIELLTTLETEGAKMKHDEAVQYAKFAQFCKDKQASMSSSIKKSGEQIALLTAETEQLTTEVADLTSKMNKQQAAIEQAKGDLQQTAEQGEKDEDRNVADVEDYRESVEALKGAIAALKRRSGDIPASPEALLLQLSRSTALPDSVLRGVTALLSTSDDNDFLTREGPEANAYEFQSTFLLDILKRLLDEFTQKRTEAEKALLNSRHSTDLAKQDLTDFISHTSENLAGTTMKRNSKVQLKAEATKQLHSTIADHDEETAALSSLEIECDEKAKSFAEKQQLRKEELKAIQEATKILSSGEVLGAAEAHLPAFIQRRKRKVIALAQLRTTLKKPSSVQEQLLHFLQSEGKRLHSKDLSFLATKLAADPFVKVKKLIEDLLANLRAEINRETQQKGFCDKELGTNHLTRTRLQKSMEELTAAIDENEALLAEAGRELSTLHEEVKKLRAAVKEASEIRAEEKAKNEEIIEDAKNAQRAIAEAERILKDFYKKAGMATALLETSDAQQPINMGSEEWQSLANPDFEGEVDWGHKAGMHTFGKTYRGQQGGAGSVFAILEVILSDFATLEAETQSAEVEATKYHQDFVRECQEDIKVKEKAMEMTETDAVHRKAEHGSQKGELSELDDQLRSANRYYDSLKPTCVDSGVTYEARKKGREDEIQSLEEALKILKRE